jgi:hypothetical protein
MTDTSLARRVWTPVRQPRTPPVRHLDFERLLGRAAWLSLSADTRARFKTGAEPRTYEGGMGVRASFAGLVIAQICRLIGQPLAPWRGEDVPVSVAVHTDKDGSLVWDRLYRFPRKRPCFVTSRKVADHRGMVEMVRGGLGMALNVTVEGGAIHFRSRGYFLEIAGRRLPLPGLMTPGRAHVIHRDLGDGRFLFSLAFDHPWLGETLSQEGIFADPA